VPEPVLREGGALPEAPRPHEMKRDGQPIRKAFLPLLLVAPIWVLRLAHACANPRRTELIHMQMNQQITFLTDGGEDIRDLPQFMNPEAEHISRHKVRSNRGR
jgi:hypothetical protein